MTAMAGDEVARVDQLLREMSAQGPSSDGSVETVAVTLLTTDIEAATGVVQSGVAEAQLIEWGHRLRALTPAQAKSLAALSLLMTWAPELSAADLSGLLGVDMPALRGWVHGTPIPSEVAERIAKIVRVLTTLELVLDRAAAKQWLESAIPALDGLRPVDLIATGNLDRLVDLTKSYLDPSYG